MRKLSDEFIDELTTGFLSEIIRRVTSDKDLDLEIRENYINIYFKGNSLLKLSERGPGEFTTEIHEKFTKGCSIPNKFPDKESVDLFLASVPFLKENIILYGKSSLEVEYEQLIIRANNSERRNASEYFIVDRQVVAGESGRFDLTGFYWNRNKRRKGQTVPLCLMEVKFALNSDIKDVDQQIARYYDAISQDPAGIAEETESILKQKLTLGLFDQDPNRLEAMKTLKISKELEEYQFILFLIDYNPFSSHLDKEKLAQLPFAKQVKIFCGGFALWERNLKKSPFTN